MSSSEKWDKIPDAELAARVRAGDAAIFNGLIKHYSHMMLGFFLSELGSDQLQQAEDLTSETMKATWVTLRGSRRTLPDNFEAWLFRTARHVLSRHLEEKVTCSEILAFESEAYDSDDQKALDDFHEVEYEQGLPQFLKLVDSAIENMPAKYRNVIHINIRDGKTGKTLAAQVGVTPAEASRLLNEARPKLVAAVAALLMARTCREAYPKSVFHLQIAEWTGGWFNEGSRRRLMQHVDSCTTCKSARNRDKWIVFLPGLTPALVTPELHQQIVNTAFVAKDGNPPLDLEENHLSDGGSNPAETSSTPSRCMYRSTGMRELYITGGRSEVADPPTNVMSDKGNTKRNGNSKFRSGVLLSTTFLLLALLGISAHNINQDMQDIMDRPMSAKSGSGGWLEIRSATLPETNNPGTEAPSRENNMGIGAPPGINNSKPATLCPNGKPQINRVCTISAPPPPPPPPPPLPPGTPSRCVFKNGPTCVNVPMPPSQQGTTSLVSSAARNYSLSRRVQQTSNPSRERYSQALE